MTSNNYKNIEQQNEPPLPYCCFFKCAAAILLMFFVSGIFLFTTYLFTIYVSEGYVGYHPCSVSGCSPKIFDHGFHIVPPWKQYYVRYVDVTDKIVSVGQLTNGSTLMIHRHVINIPLYVINACSSLYNEELKKNIKEKLMKNLQSNFTRTFLGVEFDNPFLT